MKPSIRWVFVASFQRGRFLPTNECTRGDEWKYWDKKHSLFVDQAIFGPPPAAEDASEAPAEPAGAAAPVPAPLAAVFTGVTMPAPTPPNIPGMPTLPSLTTPISLPGLPPITVSCSIPAVPALHSVATPTPAPPQPQPQPQPPPPAECAPSTPAAIDVSPYRINEQQSSGAGLWDTSTHKRRRKIKKETIPFVCARLGPKQRNPRSLCVLANAAFFRVTLLWLLPILLSDSDWFFVGFHPFSFRECYVCRLCSVWNFLKNGDGRLRSTHPPANVFCYFKKQMNTFSWGRRRTVGVARVGRFFLCVVVGDRWHPFKGKSTQKWICWWTTFHGKTPKGEAISAIRRRWLLITIVVRTDDRYRSNFLSSKKNRFHDTDTFLFPVPIDPEIASVARLFFNRKIDLFKNRVQSNSVQISLLNLIFL